MRPWSRLLLVVTAFTLWGWLWGAATVAQQSRVVGLVINEDGNSIAVLDSQTGRIVGVTDVSAALNKPHLAAYDAATQRLLRRQQRSETRRFRHDRSDDPPAA